MALTATANARLMEDAKRLLQMENPYTHRQSFNRPNLRYEIKPKSKNSLVEIAEYVKQRPRDSGIIYCLSRKDTERVAAKLSEETKMRVAHYHAELSHQERERTHRLWSQGKIPVIAATVAFGMVSLVD